MKNVKILSEEPSYAGYEIPAQEIPATDEREAIVQRDKSIRVFRKDQIDPLLEKKEFNVLPHPRMKKVSGRVFTVEGVDENGKTVHVQRHESKLDAEVIEAFDHPKVELTEAEKAAKADELLKEQQAQADAQKQANKDQEKKLKDAQKEIEELKKKLAAAKTPPVTTAKPEDKKPDDPLLSDPNPGQSEPVTK